MSEKAGYKEDYFSTYYGASDYFNNEAIIANFRNMAGEIKKRLNPKTVLDVGCACGHLVKALREIGIEAWGLDASQTAVEHAPPSVSRFVALSELPDLQIPDDFPKVYDLVVNVEVMEHLDREKAAAGVRRLTELSAAVLFSSTPRDWDEPTHIGIRQPAEWCSLFRENGYAPALDQTPNYVSSQAFLFLKRNSSDSELWQRAVNVIVRDSYLFVSERKKLIDLAQERLDIVREQQKALDAKDVHIQDQQKALEARGAHIQEMQKALDARDAHIQELQQEIKALTERGVSREQQYGAKTEELTKLVVRLSETCKREVESLEGKNVALADELDSLQRVNSYQRQALQEILVSRSYRLALKFRKLARIMRGGR